MNFSIFKFSKILFVAAIFVATALFTMNASLVFAAPAAGTPTETSPSSETTTTTSEKPPAQQLVNPIGGTNENPTGVTSVPTLIANIIKAILGIVGAVALFMFVWGGFIWLTSAGSPDKIKMGKDTLVWATIGLLVIFASYTLVDAIFRALGAIR